MRWLIKQDIERKKNLAILAVAVAFAAVVLSVAPLSHLIIHSYPENYDWQVRTALVRGNLTKAVEIAKARVSDEDYDFRARRRLAEALVAAGSNTDAVTVMTGSLDRHQAISWRNVYSRGYNVAADYRLLAQVLRQDNRVAYATEMERAANDEERLASTTGYTPPDSNTAEAPSPPPGTTWLEPATFMTSAGTTVTSAGTLHFSRKSSATATLANHDLAGHSLWFQVRGGRPMGFGSLLRISLNDKELIRIYADSASPRWISVPLPEPLPDSNLVLTAQFLNDEFDPITKADRNVELLKVGTSRR